MTPAPQAGLSTSSSTAANRFPSGRLPDYYIENRTLCQPLISHFPKVFLPSGPGLGCSPPPQAGEHFLTPLGWTKAGEGWKMAVAAVSGLIAKENVVATFGILFGFAEVAEDGAEIWGNLAQVMTPIAAYGFLVFNLLCAPCFAAMGAIKREMNNTKWFLIAIGYQCALAYVVALCIYQIGTFATTGVFGIGTVVAFLFVIAFIYLLFRPYKESKTLKVDMKKVAGER